MSLSGRAAVVTGAARGIGKAVATRLAGEGAAVVLSDVLATEGESLAGELRQSGAEAIFVRADIRDAGEVANLADVACATYGRIDVLVNNAALVQGTSLFESSIDDVLRILDINVGGTFAVSQAFAGRMAAAGNGGSIVNLSSIVALQGAPGLLGYSASKGAIAALTRSLAVALAEHDIRVNAVAPGSIGTENFLEFYEADPAMRRQLMERTPLRRLGRPDEIASVVAFLASDESSYISGQMIVSDGGRMALSYTVPG